MRSRYIVVNVAAITVVGWIVSSISFAIAAEIGRTAIMAARSDYAGIEREQTTLAVEISSLVLFGVLLAVAIIVLGREMAQARADTQGLDGHGDSET